MNNEEQKVRVFTKTFNCLEDVLKDDVCKEKINEQLKKVAFGRLAGPPSGKKFKRTRYDVLKDEGRLDYRYFVQVYPLIEQKKSTLPASQRQLIEAVVVTAIRRTVEAHSIVIEKGLSFKAKDSETLEVGFITGFNQADNTIDIKQRVGKKTTEVVWKYAETMAKFEKGELVKI